MTRWRAWVLGMAMLLPGLPVAGHEYWIAPEAARLNPGDTLRARLFVGSDMVGQEFPWLKRSVTAAEIWSPSGAAPIAAREGDMPALTAEVTEDGLHRLTMHTTPNYVIFDDLAEFGRYLDYEGLDGVMAQHQARGLPDKLFGEAYIRNARALVQVGDVVPGQVDAPTGMPFELVARGNPYVPGQGSIEVGLTWQGVAQAGVQVAVFRLAPGATAPEGVTRELLRSDSQGLVRVSLAEPGQYMVSAVRIEPVEESAAVVWQSHWASLTFEIAR